ncbi:MAG: DHH family phosphoesterase [Clostridiales bacterium]|nr:DHH family phosphoesterase [Clostridiales bacterium]
MKLSDLTKYQNITIQCHDNPDPDAIASGFALYRYFSSHRCNVRLIYSGRYKITKVNLTMMIEMFRIPIEYCVSDFGSCDLLITTDCQYRSGNVRFFPAPKVAVIDHHQFCGIDVDYSYIQSNVGSCCTLVWQLFRNEGIDINKDPLCATALYYGLYCDTNQFSELYHPLDRDMRDALAFDQAALVRLSNSNLSLSELSIAAQAMNDFTFDSDLRLALVQVQPCDPNILGLISDFLIQVDRVDICIAFNETYTGYKLSIRSCIKETKASELAEYITEDIGFGGGHKNKAGGFISKDDYSAQYGQVRLMQFLRSKLMKYSGECTILRAGIDKVSTEGMTRYRKKRIPIGVVFCKDFVSSNTPLLVRTLEGDIDINANSETCIMVGIQGEIVPISYSKFKETYNMCNAKSHVSSEYRPTIKNLRSGESFDLAQHIRSCVTKGTEYVYVKPITNSIKIFTVWDANNYVRGIEGDYIAVRENDLSDFYIIEKNLFARTYEVADS